MEAISKDFGKGLEFQKSVHVPIPINGKWLAADWIMPSHPRGIVIFAHGSGSSRHSWRNKAVASSLLNFGMGSFLLDLLTPSEEKIDHVTKHLRFNIPLLADRLEKATLWIRRQDCCPIVPIGFFGASTGAGAALIAAAILGEKVAAVVSRGGRPDLAGKSLSLVISPTLLLVGEFDEEVLALNRQALAGMHCTKQLKIIPGATHLFEEAGALEQVARLAGEWFLKHCSGNSFHQSIPDAHRNMKRRRVLR